MSAEAWLKENDAYLSASLHWLRLLLRRLEPEPPAAVSTAIAVVPATPVEEPETSAWFRWMGKSAGSPPPVASTSPPLIAEGKRVDLDQEIEDAEKAREEAAAIDPPPALILLAQRLGLTPFERDIVLLASAPEFDPSLAAAFARVHGTNTRYWPTYGLALSLLKDPAWEAVSPHRPLRHSRLLEISQPAGTPLNASALRADERTVNFIKGLNSMDDRLAPIVTPLEESGEGALSASQKGAVDKLLDGLRRAFEAGAIPIAQLIGVDEGSRRAVAQEACKVLNRRLYRVSLDALPSSAVEVETLARLWQRETLLLPVALYAEAESLEGIPAEIATALRRFLSREAGLVFVGVRDTPLRVPGEGFHIEVPGPTPAEQRDAWLAVLDEKRPDENNREAAQILAGHFNLNLQQIRQIAARVSADEGDAPPLQDLLWDAARELTRPRLDSLAQRIEAKADWDHLVLPPEQMDLMRQIVAQVRHRQQVYGDWGFAQRMNRGFGIAALFAGESGTGKTMAAEVIAKDLRLNLYRIDLSSVVSKYIGETEKNLRRLFDAAEHGGAILFFDEADALFGKRSEVKDSHDRYANIEINYLLQRLETFSGLAILATNMKSALDPAFLRRLRFIVNFPFPGAKERSLIWRKVLPDEMPKAGIDLDRLARLSISGGNIHSIALNAAFRAAERGEAVTTDDLMAAARAEMRKLDKPYSETEFRPTAPERMTRVR